MTSAKLIERQWARSPNTMQMVDRANRGGGDDGSSYERPWTAALAAGGGAGGSYDVSLDEKRFRFAVLSKTVIVKIGTAA